jgi:hypothetical protein
MLHFLTAAALGLTGPTAPPPPPPLTLQEEAETPLARFTRLEAAADEAYSAWRKRLSELQKAAREGGEPVPEEAWTPPYGEFVPSFAAAAEEYAGTPDAPRFLGWLAQNASNLPEPHQATGRAALVTLLTDHASSEALEGLAWMLGRLDYYVGKEEAPRLLAAVEAATTSRTVRAWAVFSRLSPTLDGAAVDSEEFRAAKAEVLAALEGVEDDYLSSDARNKIDVRERFSLGMVAPDIEGIDLDGTAFKLSDYEGKVLFVDFWGDW